MEWSANEAAAADLSPNNHGFAMADWREILNVRVTGCPLRPGKPPIDNKPTPSYLSANDGWARFYA